MKIHNTFHISLLRSTSNDSFIEQIQSSSFSIVVNDEEEYEVNDILNNRYHYDKLQYIIVWTDHSSNRAWYFSRKFSKSFEKDFEWLSSKIFWKIRFDIKIDRHHQSNIITVTQERTYRDKIIDSRCSQQNESEDERK